MTRLNDRVVFVTGAASGIGRATALRLASDGARTFLTDIDPKGLEETRKLASERGAEAVCRTGAANSRTHAAPLQHSSGGTRSHA